MLTNEAGTTSDTPVAGGSDEFLTEPSRIAISPDARGLEGLSGGGEVGALMRAMNWGRTALGPTELWPQSLRTIVSTCLNSRFPILVWWGADLVMLYNDAYSSIIGAKHPRALGAPGRDIFPEIWEIIGPMLGGVLARGEPTWSEDQLLVLERGGYAEECYFTFSYSPIRDETGGVGGVFTAVTETTQRIIGERRMAALRALAEQTASARSVGEAARQAMDAIRSYPADTTFAALYTVDDDGRSVRCEAVSDPAVKPYFLSRVPLDQAPGEPLADSDAWGIGAVVRSGEARRADLHDIGRLGSPVGGWPGGATAAVALPIAGAGQMRPAGVLIAGLNPRRALDDAYGGFLRLVAQQVATGLAHAGAYDAERRRAEALAELDRAKTQFFSNVSHEFRTPLTLMIGPTRDLLAEPNLTLADRDRLDLVYRNALRLQKLVNSMLDFSRIEAGRGTATFQPTDLSATTAELVSLFRSATDRAGLALVVDAPPLPQPVYVDRDMWEKIVLNLISNAFKHTFDGSITVRVRDDHVAARVEVTDTGVGIPADELPRVFERFHRVPNARSRTHEGTGIGLALVQELVRQHGGEIHVASQEGVGTTFAVSVPYGYVHLPMDRVLDRDRPAAPNSIGAGTATFVHEALRWIPVDRTEAHEPTSATAAQAPLAPGREPALDVTALRPRILVADDNADMREYTRRLLEERGWAVDVVANGDEALAVARAHRPDLVLSDVMMPGLDGLALLRALRSDSALATIPIILVSARAGDEAHAAGMEAGADDYLLKPFSAQELRARVAGQLARAQERAQLLEGERAARAAEARARHEAEAANEAKSRFLAVMSHELRTPLNAIAGHVQLLTMGIHGPITDVQRDALERIEASQRHLLRLINDVLSLARIESGRVDYHLGAVVLDDVVASLSPMIEPQMQAKHLSYEVRLPDPPLAVWADRDKLMQILLNLLSNAFKFTPAGGRITLDALTVSRVAGDVFIRVCDTGAGIPRAKQTEIFKPFVQVLTGSRRAEGAGLGLAISRDLARGMGGELRVRSVEGRGSTFTLRLARTTI